MIKIDEEWYKNIRQAEAEGKSQRATADSLGLARVTVKKYWGGAWLPGDGARRKAATPAGAGACEGGLQAIIAEISENEEKVWTRKQKLNAASMHRELTKIGIDVSERTVRRAIVQSVMLQQPTVADLILDFRAGDVMQMDWCHVKVIINGITYKVPVFCATLPYSYNVFCMPLPNMKYESFIEGHVRAFEYFGGVPERVFYDNLRTAVFKNWGAHAIKQKEFTLLESHYQFESVFMNRGKGNEKGSVENLCAIVENRFCTPIPRGESLKEINDHLTTQMIYYRDNHKIQNKTKSIIKLYREEQKHLGQLPIKPYDRPPTIITKINTDCTIKCDTNWYSAPEEYIEKEVTVLLRPYKIEIFHDGMMIAAHDRLLGKNGRSLDPHHCLKALEMKPRGALNSYALNNYRFSGPVTEFAAKFDKEKRNEVLISIMKIQKEVGEARVDFAISKALAENKYDIKTIIKYTNAKQLLNEDNKKTATIIVPEPDFSKYKINK
jgi:transposase